MQGRTLDFDLNLSFFHSLLRFCFTCLFPELGHIFFVSRPAVFLCRGQLPRFFCDNFCLSCRCLPLRFVSFKNIVSVLLRRSFLLQSQFPFITTPDSRVEAVLKFDFRSFVRSCDGLHFRCLLQQLIFPFCDFLQDSFCRETFLSLICPLSTSTPFLSSLVHCPCELWLSPAAVPGFHTGFSFKPFDTDELLWAMAFFKRVTFVVLLFPGSNGEVDGDLRAILSIELRF